MIVIFDFEVFKYNTLLGTLLVHDDNSIEVKQMWDADEIKAFYKQHFNDLWVGHNNDCYDNFILKAILESKNPYVESKKIIRKDGFRAKCSLPILTYDLMCCNYYSLKMTELCAGKRIYTSEVDFNIDRKLTEEEIEETNSYNRSDLMQTYENFKQLKGTVELRLNLLNEFKIDKRYLTATEAKLATLALHAKQIPGIEFQIVRPQIYPSLKVKNKEVLDFYLNEGFRKNEKLTVTLCGVKHQMGSGGIHAALKKCHEKDIIYLDVSGYYNLVMINYDLLPRTIPEEGKELYEYMYHEQLRLKGVDNAKRWVYKTILLAVFGASMNKYTDFYDPQIGSLITIVGQVFLVDLLEKLEGKVMLIQSNTDGIMVKPLENSSKEEVLSIVEEWCNRTGFVIKPKYIHELWQRDVNNYCYCTEDISNCKNSSIEEMQQYICVKGECVGKYSSSIDMYTYNEFWTVKEPLVVQQIVVNFLMHSIKPEKTVELCKHDLRYFQFICKQNSYDYCTLDEIGINGELLSSKRIPGLNRGFAKRYDGNSYSVITKHKLKNGKDFKAKIANLPDDIFIYNDEIMSDEAHEKLASEIDFDYYVARGYERIKEFIPFAKDITIYE